LVFLIDLIEKAGLFIPEEIKEADLLTQFAVAYRYPGLEGDIDASLYQNALDLSKRVVDWAFSVLAKGRKPE
jgi:hypothetical protein